jgi:hypothetical protein
MVERPCVDGDHCRTKLIYTEQEIYNVIENIKNYAKSCRYLAYSKLDQTIIEDDEGRNEIITLWVPIHDSLSNEISRVFEDKYLSLKVEDYRKDYIFSWGKVTDDSNHYDLDIFGIPCQRFNYIIDNKREVENCRCSTRLKKLKMICINLISILIKKD